MITKTMIYHICSKIKHLQLKIGSATNPSDSKEQLLVSNGPVHSLQLVALSATIPNLSCLARWFSASVYITDCRPVSLKEMIAADGKIYDTQGQFLRDLSAPPQSLELGMKFSSVSIGSSKEDTTMLTLCAEGLENGQQIIVFCSSRNLCEVAVRLIRVAIKRFIGGDDVSIIHRGCSSAESEVNEERMRSSARLASHFKELGYNLSKSQETLLEGLEAGVAFHHAGNLLRSVGSDISELMIDYVSVTL